MKACYGTTKYCNAFLKGLVCNNADCLYLHDVGEHLILSFLCIVKVLYTLQYQLLCSGT